MRARVDFPDADSYPPARPLVSPRLKPRLPIPPQPLSDEKSGSSKNGTTTEEVVWGETASATASPAPTREKGFVTGRPEEQFSAEAAEKRQELFNEIAPVYDQLNDLLSFGLHRVWKRAAVKWTGVREGDRAIDVCCGSATSPSDSPMPSAQPVVGLDFAAAQLRVAAEKEAKHPTGYKLSPISWQQGDALDLPHPDGSFDGAAIGSAFATSRTSPRRSRSWRASSDREGAPRSWTSATRLIRI